jgi:hypothetical protein
MADEKVTIVAEFLDKFSQPLSRMGREFKKFEQSHKSLLEGFK